MPGFLLPEHRSCLARKRRDRVRPHIGSSAKKGPLPRNQLDGDFGINALKEGYNSIALSPPIAFIDQPDVIEKILTHLGLWPHPAHAPPDGAVA